LEERIKTEEICKNIPMLVAVSLSKI